MIRLAKVLMLLVPLSLIGCMQAPPMRVAAYAVATGTEQRRDLSARL